MKTEVSGDFQPCAVAATFSLQLEFVYERCNDHEQESDEQKTTIIYHLVEIEEW